MSSRAAPGGATPEPPLWEQKPDGERLQKVLARLGLGSRRVCEEMITEGRVTVNGAVALLGSRVDVETDVVAVDGNPVGIAPGLVHYLVNKPEGVVCTVRDTHGRPTVVGLVPSDVRVYPVGRLDVDTTGLIILTNDGALTHVVSHPSGGVEKEYVAEVECGDAGVSAGALRKLRDGVVLNDGLTAPARVGQPTAGVLRIVIHEGRNRQVRRMCDAVGYPVRRLTRVRIGPIRDDKLKPGQWRPLTASEVVQLTEAAGTVHDSRF